MSSKKHKKHRRETDADKPPALKLILKVGGNISTPEHSNDSTGPSSCTLGGVTTPQSSLHSGGLPGQEEESLMSAASVATSHLEKHMKKMKKKKKKKEKDKNKEKHEKKHKHRRKEKRKRAHEDADDTSLGEDSLYEPPRKQYLSPHVKLGSTSPIKPASPGMVKAPLSPRTEAREQRACVMRLKLEQSPLSKLLDYLLKLLEKKDPKNFFAWPVSDSFAPGYSQIITHPMDFSTIRQKIDDHLYHNLMEFQDDFKLMCNNAMTYNRPDTIYYKAAKKLLHYGLRTLSPEKIIQLRSVLPYMGEVTPDQLGFEIEDEEELFEQEPNVEVEEELPQAVVEKEIKKEIKKIREMPKSKFEAIEDDLSPGEVLQETQSAAMSAHSRLLSACPRIGHMAFLRQQTDGTTSLNVLVPGSASQTVPAQGGPINLGQLIGKLTSGTGGLAGFREDRRNQCKTVKPLYYGAYGSYAPSYDSTFANVSKDETELIFQTYGDETSVQYAESILDFAKDCDYALTMVDNLLDLMTGGDHRRTKKILEERKRLREEEERIRQLMEPSGNSAAQTSAPPPAAPPPPINFKMLKTLSSLGIDTKFLDPLEKEMRKREAQQIACDAMQARLDNTAALIHKLDAVQNERLSQEPPPHLAHIPGPSAAELSLASLVTDSLVEMSAKLPPEAIAPVPAIRKALGVASIVQDEPSSVPDLESELQELLESQSGFPVEDDKTIQEIFES